jgi:DhnA family fructose-bisphosphate aldolase class Ia
MAAVIAHDLGAPVLKVPVPDATPGEHRQQEVNRVVEAVGAPVLFLGGPRVTAQGTEEPDRVVRHEVLELVADVMAGGGAGMALGRVLFQDPDPATLARQVADAVHGR